MQLRIALAFGFVATAALIGSCASRQSLEQMARAACEDEGVAPGPQMEVCVEETEETLRRAREYRPPPPSRPPAKQR